MKNIFNKNLNTILIIDDDCESLRESYSFAAKQNGFELIAYESINKGIEYINENENKIAAVLLDLSFSPGKYEGVDALETIKNTYSLLPVIILTGGVSADELNTAITCIRNGAFHYIKKDFLEMPSLFNILKIAISQYLEKMESERYNSLKEEFQAKIIFYDKILYTTELILRNLFADKLMFAPTYEKRVKEFNSFYNKLKQKEETEGFIDDPFSRIIDIAGIRVIFYNAADLQIAIEILKSSDDFIDVKDGGVLTADDKSKIDGYRATHFDIKLNPSKRLNLVEYIGLSDIPCEIQLKTIFAHSWSKVHHALSYKEIDSTKLSIEDHDRLNIDFVEAAKKLESIEQKITDICEKYYPGAK
ncbi:MAG: response regulator [Paludibacter sp.]